MPEEEEEVYYMYIHGLELGYGGGGGGGGSLLHVYTWFGAGVWGGEEEEEVYYMYIHGLELGYGGGGGGRRRGGSLLHVYTWFGAANMYMYTLGHLNFCVLSHILRVGVAANDNLISVTNFAGVSMNQTVFIIAHSARACAIWSGSQDCITF